MKEGFELLGVQFEDRGRLTDENRAAARSPGPPATWPATLSSLVGGLSP
jgi:hypothetical protein